MDPLEYEIMYQVEDHHWWYLGMEAITRALLARWYKRDLKLRILDAGCGTGAALSSYLQDYGTPFGMDVSPLALDFCQRRELQRLVLGSVTELPFASQSFDLITSFDVLYERGVRDESAALSEFARLLVPGGCLLLRLPAYNWLRGQHDETVHTARRFTAGQVRDLLKKADFRLKHLSYANTLLFPFALLKRLLERLRPGQKARSDLALQMGPLDSLFRSILKMEAPLIARVGLPYGLSIFAVGQKSP